MNKGKKKSDNNRPAIVTKTLIGLATTHYRRLYIFHTLQASMILFALLPPLVDSLSSVIFRENIVECVNPVLLCYSFLRNFSRLVYWPVLSTHIAKQSGRSLIVPLLLSSLFSLPHSLFSSLSFLCFVFLLSHYLSISFYLFLWISLFPSVSLSLLRICFRSATVSTTIFRFSTALFYVPALSQVNSYPCLLLIQRARPSATRECESLSRKKIHPF